MRDSRGETALVSTYSYLRVHAVLYHYWQRKPIFAPNYVPIVLAFIAILNNIQYVFARYCRRFYNSYLSHYVRRLKSCAVCLRYGKYCTRCVLVSCLFLVTLIVFLNGAGRINKRNSKRAVNRAYLVIQGEPIKELHKILEAQGLLVTLQIQI